MNFRAETPVSYPVSNRSYTLLTDSEWKEDQEEYPGGWRASVFPIQWPPCSESFQAPGLP